MENPYQVLGVSTDADISEIKKAYKKLCLKWHPDKNRDSTKSKQVKQMFLKIQNAYEILTDPEKKQMYDQFGTTDINNLNQNRKGNRNPFDDFFENDHFGNAYQHFPNCRCDDCFDKYNKTDPYWYMDIVVGVTVFTGLFMFVTKLTSHNISLVDFKKY